MKNCNKYILQKMDNNKNQSTMKTKQLFLLCTLWLTVSLTALAQEPVATLEHSGTTKVYYGEGSFEQAYSASVNGDQIYLSSGRFTFTNIA